MSIPEDQYELYAEFGIAAEMAQCLEVDAGNVALSYLMFFVKPDQVSHEVREMFKGLMYDLDRRTLGTLLKYVKSRVRFDEKILEVVDEALDGRNYLMHRFFRTHNFAICSVAGRKAMVEELRNIQSKLNLARWMLRGLSEGLDNLSGKPVLDQKRLEQLEGEGKRLKIFPKAP